MREPVELTGYDPIAKLLHWLIVLLLGDRTLHRMLR
jgi:hypothetical protein